MAVVPSWLAGALVFFTSAAVLVLEILAGRLLAPYVGVRLETYTAVIGTVLAGIAVGTWLGGRLADRVDPRRTLGPLLVAGGALALASVPVVRLAGSVGEVTIGEVLYLAVAGFFAPAAVLSAVNPAVVKLQLNDLAVTGAVVGRLSALGTTGAIAGTFLAGFVLVAAASTTTVILSVGGALIAAGVVLWLWLAATAARVLVPTLLVAAAVAAAAVGRGPCDVETRYHCAQVVADPSRAGGRVLLLDILRHSYVDLDDPTHLEFRYTKVFADVVATADHRRPLFAVHVGGGGFTMPRYLAATSSRSQHLVLEIDPELIELARERLGLETGPRLQVRAGDARLLLRDIPRDAADFVFGDAFGDLAVPWHLTTTEFARDVHRVLRPRGVYLLNLIDYPPLRFVKAEVATLGQVFRHVAVVAPPPLLDGVQGGNYVVAASDASFDRAAITARIQDRAGDEDVLTGRAVAALAAGSRVLSDDYAPVDQWLARSRPAVVRAQP